jgi:hypothetical protein
MKAGVKIAGPIQAAPLTPPGMQVSKAQLRENLLALGKVMDEPQSSMPLPPLGFQVSGMNTSSRHDSQPGALSLCANLEYLQRPKNEAEIQLLKLLNSDFAVAFALA